jgi:hypothetical protein
MSNFGKGYWIDRFNPTNGGQLSALSFTGAQDGVNPTFVLSSTPNPLTIQVFWNGLKLKLGIGYTVNGNVLTMLTGFIPQSLDSFEVLG